MKSLQKILAIETSGELCSVALFLSENEYDERNILRKHIHSEKLIPVIEELLKSNNLSASDFDAIAVSIGPGSFTGLRIGMTAAKGIAFAINLPIIPIPTFEALSLQISETLKDGTQFSIVNNANIDECYLGLYSYKNGEVKSLSDVRLVEKSSIESEIDKSDLIFGDLSSIEHIRNINSPRGIFVAKWAYLFGQDLLTFDYDYLEPNYLKQFKVIKKK